MFDFCGVLFMIHIAVPLVILFSVVACTVAHSLLHD